MPKSFKAEKPVKPRLKLTDQMKFTLWAAQSQSYVMTKSTTCVPFGTLMEI